MDVDLPEGELESPQQKPDIANLEDDALLQSFVLAKSSGPPYSEASRILASLLYEPLARSVALQEQIHEITHALLAKPGFDVTYVHILSLLSDELLQKLMIEIIQFYGSPQDIETRYSLLINFQKLFPRCIDEYQLLELFMGTGNVLLDEASRKCFAYNNRYRDYFVTQLFPLLMSSTKAEELLPYYLEQLSKVILFYMGCLLNTFPDEEIVSYHPDACWQSLFQILTEVCRLGKFRLPKLWDLTTTSVDELKFWWRRYVGWRKTPDENGQPVRGEISFFLICSFWTFLIVLYSDGKTECEMPGRRPFLLRLGEGSRNEVQLSLHKDKQKAARKLKDTLVLAAQVWDTLNLPDVRPKTTRSVSLLHLEDSSVFLTFRWDHAALTKNTLVLPISSDMQPSWLKTQLLSQNILHHYNQGLTQSGFEDICRLIRMLRVQNTQPTENRETASSTEGLRYIWTDYEIFSACCGLLVEHLVKQPLDRAGDDCLSVLITIIQPVASEQMLVLQQVLSVLASRQKFIYKRFFEFVVLPDILCEFSALLGKVVLELQLEAPTVSTPVHKTRGANRESTEALQGEFQRYIANGHGNPFLAVQKYLRMEKDNVARVLFSASNISPKRGRPNSS